MHWILKKFTKVIDIQVKVYLSNIHTFMPSIVLDVLVTSIHSFFYNSERSTVLSVANYRPIFITSVLSKVFERLVSVRFGRFMKRSGVLPTTQFAYRKGLGTCDALLCVSRTLQSALENGQEASIM